MAARGSIAKSTVTKKLAEAFGTDYIGEVDKKIYVWANDGGTRVQIALALTCPKTFVDAPNSVPVVEDHDWDDAGMTAVAPPAKVDLTISEEEKENIAKLMASLGL